MAKYKIRVTDDCIGCEACVAVCDNFKMNDDCKSEPVQDVIYEIGDNQEAMEACPVEAIKIERVDE